MKVFTVLSKPLRSLLALVLVGILGAWAAIPTSAQTSQVPDFTQFDFPQITGTAMFTPGQATTLMAGNQKVDIPADFLSKPVKFEFLEGDTASFVPDLAPADQGKQIVAAFAFRVTDSSTGQLIGKFDKPVVYSITDPRITSDSEVYNTSPSNPPKVTDNPTAPTIQGAMLSHPFGGAGVGWLISSPALPAGMPRTGAGTGNGTDSKALLTLLLASFAVLAGGISLQRKGKRAA